MSRAPHRGFTLIELLVVITVISMLIGLLLPGIGAVKESMRAKQCANRLINIGKATLAYVYRDQKQRFPGYSNNINKPGGTSTPVSWGVVLLQNLDQGQLFERIKGGDRTPLSQPYLEVFNCPSSPPENFSTSTSSFVANCGKPDTQPDKVAHGIFFDRSGAGAIDFTMDKIKDGPTMTIMFTENINCASWSASFPTGKGPTEAQVGFCWWDNDLSGSTKLPIRKINGLKNKDPKDNPPPADTVDWARPSSNHSGGVNAFFCDSHTVWVREDIAYHVYQQLLTPDGENAVPVALDPNNANKPFILTDSDFR